jgi:hypothetical protein
MKMEKKKTSVLEKSNTNQIFLHADKGKSEKHLIAEVTLSSPILSAVTSKSFTKNILGESHLTEVIDVMKEKVNKVNQGDLTELEATLTSQLVSLDAMFNELARRAINSETMSKLEIYMRLSLKAQSQSARTVEVLAAMKNPPLVIAKQANISNGNQQVNNLNKQDEFLARAGEIINHPNELLAEVKNGS